MGLEADISIASKLMEINGLQGLGSEFLAIVCLPAGCVSRLQSRKLAGSQLRPCTHLGIAQSEPQAALHRTFVAGPCSFE
jgi:hypothetical protein